jgi:hypothetical protein
MDGYTQSPRSRRTHFALQGAPYFKPPQSKMTRNADIGLSAQPANQL